MVLGRTPVLPAEAETPFVEALQELLQARLGLLFGFDPSTVTVAYAEGKVSLEVAAEVDDPQIEMIVVQTLQDMGVVFSGERTDDD